MPITVIVRTKQANWRKEKRVPVFVSDSVVLRRALSTPGENAPGPRGISCVAFACALHMHSLHLSLPVDCGGLFYLPMCGPAMCHCAFTAAWIGWVQDGWMDASYHTVNLFVPSKPRASSLGRTARQRNEEIFNTKLGYFPWQEYLFFSYAHSAVEKKKGKKRHRSLAKKTPSSPSISSRTHQTASCQSPQMCSWISGRWKWSDALIENFAVSE